MFRDFSPGVTVVEESLPGHGLTWVVWPAVWPELFEYVDPGEYHGGVAIGAFQWWPEAWQYRGVSPPTRAQRLMAKLRL